MAEKSKNKQLVINMTATFISFIVSFGISFFLTPFIVKSLGATAYGFVGLTNNIISYTELVTIALNCMAGRFITIKYAQGKTNEANKYFSSVFYSNIILSALIVLVTGGCILYIEHIFDIPQTLISDVKLLLALLVINTIIGLMMNVFSIATFVKNRLELSSIRNIIASLIKAGVLSGLFIFWVPHLWYIGISGMLYTLYSSYANYRYTRILTPELKIRRTDFDYTKVKELLSSGIWGLLARLGTVLGSGLDLVIANLCIGAAAMGFFSLTKNVPTILLSLFASISAVFAPLFTTLYAKRQKKELQNELHKSIRLLGFLSSIPIACIFAFGDNFYSLWLPGEDYEKLQLLTILGCIGLVFSMPLDALWNIFIISNKLKYSTLFYIAVNIVVLIAVLLSTIFVKDSMILLFILASMRSFINMIRSLVFLPLYGAHCLELKKSIFYKPIIKATICTLFSCIIAFCIKNFLDITSWISFISATSLSAVCCLILNSFIILEKSDRHFIFSKIKKHIYYA